MRNSFFTVLASFTYIVSTAASPLSANTTLEKRVVRSGRGTFFEVGLGACGQQSVDSDPVVALSTNVFNNGANCGQSVTITDTDTGVTATGIVLDECPSCGDGDLDLSPSLFQQFASPDVGVIPISWQLSNGA